MAFMPQMPADVIADRAPRHYALAGGQVWLVAGFVLWSGKSTLTASTFEALASRLAAHRAGRLPTQVFYSVFGTGGCALLAASLLFRPPAITLLALYSGMIRMLDWCSRTGRNRPSPRTRERRSARSRASPPNSECLAFISGFGPLAQATSYRAAFAAYGGAGVLTGLAYLARSLRPRRA